MLCKTRRLSVAAALGEDQIVKVAEGLFLGVGFEDVKDGVLALETTDL